MKRIFASGFSTPILLKTIVCVAASIVLATVVLVMAATPSSNPSNYDETKGDFILGFRKVGSTSSILVDIGPITDFSTTQTFSLGALGSLLSSTYGSGWANSPDVYFSLAATNRPEDGTVKVNYVTSPEYAADGVPAKIWSRLTNTNSGILQNKIFTCGDDFNTFAVQSGTNAVLEPSTSPDAYQNFMPGGTNDAGHATQANIGWGFFNPTPEGSFKNGAAGVDLVLVQLVPGAGSGTNRGNFVLSADGSILTFTPVSTGTPTPTPSPTPTPTPTPTPSPTPTPASGHPAFFNGEVSLGKGVYYHTFANGNFFSYYAYLSDPHFIYHFDLGYEYVFDAQDAGHGVFLYDFASNTFFYTSPTLPFPYLYDFSRSAFLYYYPDVPADGRYTHNPRYFYDMTHGMVITK